MEIMNKGVKEEIVEMIDYVLSRSDVKKSMKGKDAIGGGDEIALKISESLTFALTKKGSAEYSYKEYITYTFTFKNKTDRDISGVKGSVTFYDMFDEKIKSLTLSYDDGIKANKTINYKATTDYNQFKSEDKKLKSTELSKIKVTWEPEQLIFSDGEKVSLE